MIINHEELANVCEVTKEGLRQWVQEGLPKAGRNKYDLALVIAWVRRNKPLKGITSDLTGERTKFVQIQRELKTLELMVKRGDLIAREEVLGEFMNRIGIVKQGLLSLHRYLPPILGGLEPKQMAGVIKKYCHELLDKFSRKGGILK